MSNFKEIKPEELNKSAFQLIGSDWMLIAAEKDNKVNAMTASWGGFGVMWGKNVVYIVLRPQRYTKEFVDNSNTFSISFLGSEYKKLLGYFGSVSGRDEDKVEKSKLTVSHLGDTPYFEESNIVLKCKKLYAQEFKPECFIQTDLDEKWYSEKDYHTMYVAEIEKALIKEI